MPIAYFMAVIALSLWLLKGAPPMEVPLDARDWPTRAKAKLFGRRRVARIAWKSWIAIAQIKMGRYLTMQEMIANLKEKQLGKA